MISRPLERVIGFVDKYCNDNWKQWKEDDYHLSMFQTHCIENICPYRAETLNDYVKRFSDGNSDIQQWIDAIHCGELIMRARMRELKCAYMYQNALASLADLTARDVIMDSDEEKETHEDDNEFTFYSSMASMSIDGDYFII
jgi:hypothetical protein